MTKELPIFSELYTSDGKPFTKQVEDGPGSGSPGSGELGRTYSEPLTGYDYAYYGGLFLLVLAALVIAALVILKIRTTSKPPKSIASGHKSKSDRRAKT